MPQHFLGSLLYTSLIRHQSFLFLYIFNTWGGEGGGGKGGGGKGGKGSICREELFARLHALNFFSARKYHHLTSDIWDKNRKLFSSSVPPKNYDRSILTMICAVFRIQFILDMTNILTNLYIRSLSAFFVMIWMFLFDIVHMHGNVYFVAKCSKYPIQYGCATKRSSAQP
jgi:hypothetical protein